MNRKVLFVDDEPGVLSGIRRQLRKHVDVVTAGGGEEGLQQIEEHGPFSVVVSDMRMPVMNGAEFLARVATRCPDTVKVILSGQAELEATIQAVNTGQLFRFLTKPCSAEVLLNTVNAGIEQYRLINAERELLEETLQGAVDLLTELLGITNPAAFNRASRIRTFAEQLGSQVGLDGDWKFKIASALSQIGCVTLPSDTLAKVYAGQQLTPEEEELYQKHANVAADLVVRIPRLDEVAEIIVGQTRELDFSELPSDLSEWDTTTLGGQMLHMATHLDQLISGGTELRAAKRHVGKELPESLAETLTAVTAKKEEVEIRLISINELVDGMVLDEDLMSSSGMRLMPTNQEITKSSIVRLRTVHGGIGVREPFRVRVYN